MATRRCAMLLGLALACSLLGAAHAAVNINMGAGGLVDCATVTGSITVSSVLVTGVTGAIVDNAAALAHPYAVCFSAMTITVTWDGVSKCKVTLDTTNDIPTDILYPTAWSTNNLYPDSELLACPRTLTVENTADFTLFSAVSAALEDALWTPTTVPAYLGSARTFIFGYEADLGAGKEDFTCGAATTCGVLGLWRNDGLKIAYAVTASSGTFSTATMAKVACGGVVGSVGHLTTIGSAGDLCRDSGIVGVGFACSAGTYKSLLNQYTSGGTQDRYLCLVNYAGSSTAAGATAPTICPVGSALPSVQGTACTTCPAGYVAKDNHGSSHCKPCDVGYFQWQAGKTDCIVCPTGTFSYVPGSIACVKCIRGTVFACTGGLDTTNLDPAGCAQTAAGGGYSVFTINNLNTVAAGTGRLRSGDCPAVTTSNFPLLSASQHTLDLFAGAIGTDQCTTYLAADQFSVSVNEFCWVDVMKLNDAKCSNPMNTNWDSWVLNGFAAILSDSVLPTGAQTTPVATATLGFKAVTILSQMPSGESAPYTDYTWRLDTQSTTALTISYFHATKDPDVRFPTSATPLANFQMKVCADTATVAGGRVGNVPTTSGLGGPVCPAGTQDQESGANDNLCKPCIPGYVCSGASSGLAAPAPCPGKAQPLYGVATCPAAYCASGTGTSGSTGVVSSGTVGINPGDTCVACDIGYYSCDGTAGCTATTNGICSTCWSAATVNIATCPLGATVCNPGTVRNPGTLVCEPCPAGFYKSSETECTACPAGTYNPYDTVYDIGAGTVTKNDISACLCAGKPAQFAGACTMTGLTAETDRVVALEPSAVEVQTCQNGAIATRSAPAVTGSFGFDTCTPCIIGSIQVNNECLVCGAGAVGSANPPGTYRPGGLSTINNNRCLRIPPGYKADAATGGSILSLCGVGTVSYWTGTPVARNPAVGNTCEPCATNTFSAKTGGARCVLCRAGSEATSIDGITGNEICRNCALRTYRAALETTGLCATCPAGFETRAAFGAAECTACPPGYWYQDVAAGAVYLNIDNSASATIWKSAKCQPCPVNYYQPKTGQTGCTVCAAGYYTPDTGNTECTACSPGTYNPTAGGNCIDATKGTYVATAGAIATSKCPVGRYTDDEGNDVCTICPAGTYSNNPGSTSCKLCAAGTYSKRGSSTCLDCLPGYYSPAGAGACLSCKPGYYNNLERAGFCLECPIGSYCPTANLENPIPCRAGMYSTLDTQTSCKKCPPDTYQSATGSTACISCDLAGAALGGTNTKGYTTRGTWGVSSPSGCVAPRTVKKLKRAL